MDKIEDTPAEQRELQAQRPVTACTVRLNGAQAARLTLLSHQAMLSKEMFLRARAGLVSGICRVCGCTDQAGCPDGCTWHDKVETLCSRCADHLFGDGRDQWGEL